MGIKHTIKGKEVDLALPLLTRDWRQLKKESGVTLKSLGEMDIDTMATVAQVVLTKSGCDIQADELTLTELRDVMSVIAEAESGQKVDRPS